MTKEMMWKGSLTLLITSVTTYFNELALPIVLLVLMMAIDYLTGMANAWIHAELSSRIGIVGIVKKIGQICAVCVGIGVDFIIVRAAAGWGVHFPDSGTVAIMVAVWLAINEMISILENLSQLGVPLPGFLVAAVEKLKIKSDNKEEQ